MPTWNEICQVLEELQTLILEVQIELADPGTAQDKRPGLQQLLTACETTQEEIMDKYGNRLSPNQPPPGLPGKTITLLGV